MKTLITFIDPSMMLPLYTIEIDSNKRELYENEIYELLQDNNSLNSMLIICNTTGDHFILSKDLANKYLIKISIQF